MLGSGNGDPMQCVSNLVRIVRGECTYDRVKGVDPTIIDRPASIAAPLLQAEVKWLLKTYEPRMNINEVNIEAIAAKIGSFALNIDATVTG